MSKWFRYVLIVALALALTGCGVRTAYNNLDWLIMRWVNKQVSLDNEQELLFRTALDEQLRWHCASQLPDYVSFLNTVDQDLTAGRLDAERLKSHAETLAGFGRQLLTETRPVILDLMASLDDRQVEELLEGVDKRNRELKEESVDADPAQRQQEQVESMARGMKRFIGRLNSDQEQRLFQWAADLQPTGEQALAQRLAWREAFAQTLELRSDRTRFDALMTELLEPGSDWSDEYRHKMELNRQITVVALADVHGLASERQVRRLRSRLNSLADDFQHLSCT